jgi:hypothetical protein
LILALIDRFGDIENELSWHLEISLFLKAQSIKEIYRFVMQPTNATLTYILAKAILKRDSIDVQKNIMSVSIKQARRASKENDRCLIIFCFDIYMADARLVSIY